MNKSLKITIFLARIALAVLFLYSGLTKVMDSNWSAAGYLQAAKTFPGLFHWFASSANLGWINIVNSWGQLLLGISLLLGLFVRWSSLAGIVLMILYYLPNLQFPYIAPHSFLVDEHVIYALALGILLASNAGRFWGLDGLFKRKAA